RDSLASIISFSTELRVLFVACQVTVLTGSVVNAIISTISRKRMLIRRSCIVSSCSRLAGTFYTTFLLLKFRFRVSVLLRVSSTLYEVRTSANRSNAAQAPAIADDQTP